jgi:hypothetical protein
MLNSSKADHLADDPTVTRCMSRAMAGNYGRLECANLFPLLRLSQTNCRRIPIRSVR